MTTLLVGTFGTLGVLARYGISRLTLHSDALIWSTVGINIAGKHESVTVAAEDALIAALKVKCERPDALINYVRRRNKRGDVRHPHGAITAKPE